MKLFNSRNRVSITNPLFVFTGESNSGGFADNTELTAGELAVRPSVIIQNNNSGGTGFENLDIGTNNNQGHSGLDPTTHGWENGLAHAVEEGMFSVSSVHLVQTGQGGTRIVHWLDDAATYNTIHPWTLFKTRVNAALAIDSTYKIIVFYSQGINDINDGNTTSYWKTATINHINKIRAVYGSTVPFIMTKFGMSGFTSYNSTIDEICNELPYVWSVDTTGLALKDTKHWNAQGMKDCARLMVDRLLQNYKL